MKDIRPSSIVEDRGFCKLLSTLDPRYVPPSRHTIMRSLLPDRYAVMKEKITSELESVEVCSLTSDFWTARTSTSYVTVTCHFINSSWVMKSYVLATYQVDVSHTAENVAKELKKVASEWKITEKVVCVTTDNASNMVAGVRLTGWKHLPCLGHTLNLIVCEAIKKDEALSTLQEKCRKVVKFFKQSNLAHSKLSQLQLELKGEERKLIQDVCTRWNSTYYMCVRLVEEHNVVTTALCLLERPDLIITSSDLLILKDAIALLEPFEEATRELSTEKFVSVSKVIPIARSLQAVISKSSSVRPLKLELLEQMQRRFLNMEGHNILCNSTLFDPRFKKLGFTNQSCYNQAVQRLVAEVGAVASSEEPLMTNESGLQNPCGSSGLWAALDERVANSHSTSVTASSMIMLRTYLDQPNVSRMQCPLAWWKNMPLQSYSKLIPIVKKYLCISCSSVPAERLFSKAGEVISAKRSSIKPKNVDMILFLNKLD